MILSQIRIYAPLDSGDFQLTTIVCSGTSAAPEVPQVLIDALKAEGGGIAQLTIRGTKRDYGGPRNRHPCPFSARITQ